MAAVVGDSGGFGDFGDFDDYHWDRMMAQMVGDDGDRNTIAVGDRYVGDSVH